MWRSIRAAASPRGIQLGSCKLVTSSMVSKHSLSACKAAQTFVNLFIDSFISPTRQMYFLSACQETRPLAAFAGIARNRCAGSTPSHLQLDGCVRSNIICVAVQRLSSSAVGQIAEQHQVAP